MPSSTSSARWIIAYGVFLIVVGLLGFLSNPEKAKTALISGGTFGLLCCGLGWLASGGRPWAERVALGVTAFLTVVFGIRGTISWNAYLGGDATKLVAAVLITSMFVASVVLLIRLVGDLRRCRS